MKKITKNLNMKPFINKCLLLSVAVCMAACSSKEETNQLPEVTQTVTVEQTVLPPTQAPVETPTPVTQQTQPVAKVAVKRSTKTLYPNEVLLNLKAWDSKLKFLKTSFTQTTSYDGVVISSSTGILYYDKDKNLLRLDTDDGDGKIDQSAVTDKKQILILDGQGREITTLSWQEWQQGQPNQALFDFGNYTALLARHNATLKEPYVLELTPKEGENYTLSLTLSKEDYFPQEIKIVSDLTQTTAILSNIQKNEPLAFDTFRQGGMFK